MFEGAEEESTKITTLTPTAACLAAAMERYLMHDRLRHGKASTVHAAGIAAAQVMGG